MGKYSKAIAVGQSAGFIYAMRAGEFIKFGWAKDVEARRLQLQTGCPQKIEVIAAAQWPRELESAIHRKLQDSSSCGEWFQFGPDADAVVAMMQDDDFSGLEEFIQEKKYKGLGAIGSPQKLVKEFTRALGLVLAASLTKNQMILFCALLEEVRDDGVIDVPNWIIADKTGIAAANTSRDMKVLVKAGILSKSDSQRGRYVMNPPFEWESLRNERSRTDKSL